MQPSEIYRRLDESIRPELVGMNNRKSSASFVWGYLSWRIRDALAQAYSDGYQQAVRHAYGEDNLGPDDYPPPQEVED